MTENLVKYHCKVCEKNFYLEEVEGGYGDFIWCPLCNDFRHVKEKKSIVKLIDNVIKKNDGALRKLDDN